MVNKLSIAKRVQLLNMMIDGSSMHSVSRVVGVSINTVTKLLVEAGEACAAYHDEHVRGVEARRIQCNEIWSFCCAKHKNVKTTRVASEEAGDVWTWTALDFDSKLITSYLVGGRDSEYAIELMDDVVKRLANRVQLTTDGHKAYLEAVEGAFGGNVDYAQLVKLYGAVPETAKGKYSPADCVGARKAAIEGKPVKKDVNTLHVERQNSTMRMSVRRFTRLTNAFSKKLENHIHMLSIYFVHYNFCRIHKTLKITPAMAAGIDGELHDIDWIVGVIDAWAPKPSSRGQYKKSNSN